MRALRRGLGLDQPPEAGAHRVEGGLVVDIRQPDFETKVAILRHKSEVAHVELDDDTAYFLAGKIKSHVRELESYFNRVVLVSSMRGEPITRELAEEALRGILPDDSQKTSPAEIPGKRPIMRTTSR